jgi:uncharacterized surface protein with fasciclin (FAS1) repeats
MTKQLLVILAGAILMVGCAEEKSGDSNVAAGEDNTSTYEENTPKGQASYDDDVSDLNILEIAIGSADHSTLVAAVQAAEIEHVLVNAGPLTIFAPVNSAFDALPEGVVADLLKPENKSQLSFVLINHAAPSTYKDNLLNHGRKIYMASGNYIEVTVEDDKTFIGGAEILATVDASNGVIHVIDKVLVP